MNLKKNIKIITLGVMALSFISPGAATSGGALPAYHTETISYTPDSTHKLFHSDGGSLLYSTYGDDVSNQRLFLQNIHYSEPTEIPSVVGEIIDARSTGQYVFYITDSEAGGVGDGATELHVYDMFTDTTTQLTDNTLSIIDLEVCSTFESTSVIYTTLDSQGDYGVEMIRDVTSPAGKNIVDSTADEFAVACDVSGNYYYYQKNSVDPGADDLYHSSVDPISYGQVFTDLNLPNFSQLQEIVFDEYLETLAYTLYDPATYQHSIKTRDTVGTISGIYTGEADTTISNLSYHSVDGSGGPLLTWLEQNSMSENSIKAHWVNIFETRTIFTGSQLDPFGSRGRVLVSDSVAMYYVEDYIGTAQDSVLTATPVKGDFYGKRTKYVELGESYSLQDDYSAGLYYYAGLYDGIVNVMGIGTIDITKVGTTVIQYSYAGGYLSSEDGFGSKVIVIYPKDISGNMFFVEVLGLVERSISGGYPDGTFRPNNTINRAEVAAMFVRALRLEGEDISLYENENKFTDVSSSHWAYRSIIIARENSIIGGKPGNVFDPAATVTRAELAAMAARLLPDFTGTPKTAFADTQGHWAASDIQKVYNYDIVNGTSATTYTPNGKTTRGQNAKILTNFLANIQLGKGGI